MKNTEMAMLQQVLSLLQQVVGQSAPAAGSSASSLVPQLQKLITELKSADSSPAAGPGAATTTTATATPTPAGASSSTKTPAPVASDPADGISGAEINAMLAEANGTGPAVMFSAWDAPASSAPAQSSPNMGGQVAALNQEVGSEAA